MVLPNELDKLLKGRPCAIVASSGMLTGGASLIYAPQLVATPRTPSSSPATRMRRAPGRALPDLADEVKEKGEGVLCKVNRYGLSAHADGGQLLNVVCSMEPKHVLLVHGDDPAREALSTPSPRPANRSRMGSDSWRRVYATCQPSKKS